ncbi:MAG TPA: hypothetical protein VMV18_14505 [bacterium]|nr:hypothetical protein [bacterium]
MARRPVLRAALAAALAAILPACSRGASGEGSTASPDPGLVSRDHEIDNEKLIAWLKGRVDANPAAGGRERLIAIYTRRGQMRGRLDDFQACVTYATQDVDLTHSAGALESRARCEISLHRFSEAEADLAEAARHFDPAPEERLALQGDIARARGRYEDALDLYRRAQRGTNAANMARMASLDAELGDTKGAEALFDAAEALLSGHDGALEAWLLTQRAAGEIESGELTTASERLARARALDPKNVLAEQYSAQLLARNGRDGEARALYQSLIAATDNPEYMSRLALLRRKAGDDAGAAALVADAKARYQADLSAFPEALWQHYGQFLLDQGLDANEAVDVLAKNAASRPSAASFIPLASAQLAAGDIAGAKATIEKALATPVKTARLFWTAARVMEAAGETERATELRARALALNPRVADLL